MSQRITFGYLRDNIAFDTLNVCPTDPRFTRWVNAAQEMMLNQGRWVGSIREIRICTVDECIVLPRQVATVEQVALCDYPITYNNQFYQFTRLLAKIPKCDGCTSNCTGCSSTIIGACGHVQAQDANDRCSYKVTTGTNKKIRIYPTSEDDVGKNIIFQGNDANGVWVQTVIDGTVQDGEQVTLALPFVDTVTVWGPGAPMGVIKDETEYNVQVYSVNQDDATEVQLSVYEPTETLPMYRTLQIPRINKVPCNNTCTDGNGSCIKPVTALVSLQHIPVKYDNDWMLFTNVQAYQAGIMAAKAMQEGNYEMFNYYFYGSQSAPNNNRGSLRVVNRGGAIPLLRAELDKMTGGKQTLYAFIDESNVMQRTMVGFR